MLHVSAIPLAHLNSPSSRVYIGLFTDVENGDHLRQQLLAGNPEFEYAFINCDTLVGTSQVLAACFRAINDAQQNRLRSRNVHSEIVFSLGTNNNIATSLKAFGVDASTTHLLAIKVAGFSDGKSPAEECEAAEQHLTTHIQGRQLLFTDENISNLTDWSKVRRIYKLSEMDASKLAGIDRESRDKRQKDAETAIIGMIALRGS